jgi:hypothetical protein
MRHGTFTDVDIMSVYDVIYSFHKSMHTVNADLHNTDCKCIAKLSKISCENKDDDGVCNSVKHSIVNHYELVKVVGNQFIDLIDYISNTLNDKTDVTCNIEHSINFTGNNYDFSVFVPNNKIILTSKKNVVIIMIQPSFTVLNCNDIFINAILNTFICNNQPEGTNNLDKFNGKNVYICIFTLSSATPIWINIKLNDGTLINNCIKSALYDKYSKYNKKVFKVFEYLKQNNNSVKTCDLIINETNEFHHNYPEYIKEFFNIARESSKKLKKCTVQSVDDINEFLRTKLDEWIDPEEVYDF